MIEFHHGDTETQRRDRELSSWTDVWKECYSSRYDDALYDENLKKLAQSRSSEDFREAIEQLFVWKNGTPLSVPKAKAVRRIRWSDWKKWKDSGEFPVHFSGTIWNLFLVHLLTDGKRPIFDQHTWRAFCFLTRRGDMPLSKYLMGQQLDCYKEYEKWFLTQAALVDGRNLDRALMAFGQFLKSQFLPLMSFLPSVSL